ncbi:MAG: ATP-binding protein [Lachnospiraceae bacterium]|nr:ATP-binding protein [Lachnospiraceae bacterium]
MKKTKVYISVLLFLVTLFLCSQNQPTHFTAESSAKPNISISLPIDNFVGEEVGRQEKRWEFSMIVLLITVIILAAILFFYSRTNEKRLMALVEERTGELIIESERLKTIFETIPDMAFCMDKDLRYIITNKKMQEHFGFTEADAIGKMDYEVLEISDDVVERLSAINRRVVAEVKPIIYEDVVPNANGEDIHFETTKVPLIYNGNVIGLMGIARDITKRKTMEEEALQASRMKSSFLANMSHELRSPLNVIIGLTDLSLEEEGLSNTLSANLQSIGNAGRTLLSIVNDILDLSKIESGKLSLVPVNYETPSLLNDIIVLTKTYIGEKPIRFRLLISEEFPVKLYGDELRIKEILTNLLSNAVKYTNSGEIILELECCREKDFIWFKAVIKDTGIGIKQNEIEDLFLDYYQADQRSNRHISGTGLGLPITKKMVEMMNGSICVESEYGKGSTFTVTVKQGYLSDQMIGKNVALSLSEFHYHDEKQKELHRLERVDLSGKRVLVVDDIQNNLDVAAGLLKKYGMQVDCLLSGRAAINMLEAGTKIYDLIFMDHMMPEMDGIEAVKYIRAIDSDFARNVTIIALTANAVSGAKELFLGNGFQDFLSKPISVMNLDKILKKWVKENDEVQKTEIKRKLSDLKKIDYHKAMLMYDGDEEILEAIIASFMSNTSSITENMKKLFAELTAGDVNAEDKRLNDFGILAHGIKGSCSSIAAEKARLAAYNLEMAAKSYELDKCRELFPIFLQEIDDLLSELSC